MSDNELSQAKADESPKTDAPQNGMLKREILIIAVLILLAAAGILIYQLTNAEKTASDKISVYVDGTLYCSQTLRPGETITVAQEDGSVNVIRMTEKGFYMESSTCHNQLCISQGEVTRDNWSTRYLGTHVYCLPNRVDVTLEVEAQTAAPDMPDV